MVDRGDSLRALRTWLVGEDLLRGRARVVTSPPPEGALGSTVETLAIALAPGGAVTVLASALITWIRRQRGDITLKVVRPDGASVEFSGANARLEDDNTRRLLTDLLQHADSNGDIEDAR
ncbi:effector-associated constant component EACC1 [Nocardia gipuzkoensis]